MTVEDRSTPCEPGAQGVKTPRLCARLGCTNTFEPYRASQKFCSHSCRTLAWLGREAAKASERANVRELDL